MATVVTAVDTFLKSADLVAMRTNIGLAAIANGESFGYADALISRNAAGRLNVPSLNLAGVANTPLLSGTGYSLTGSAAQSAIDIAGTWNTSGTPTLIKANVTDTASNAASLLMDLQVGGSSKFNISKSGTVTLANQLSAAGSISSVVGGLLLASATATISIGGDTIILRDGAANTLGLRNAANAQTLRVYGTYTDVSNYRRIRLTMSTAGVAELTVAGAGTGASGNVLHISGLPTSNPGAGILWNNAGTPAIGT